MTNNTNQMMRVAETIRSQIHPHVLMCSASRNFGAFENEIGMYGIQFKIQLLIEMLWCFCSRRYLRQLPHSHSPAYTHMRL